VTLTSLLFVKCYGTVSPGEERGCTSARRLQRDAGRAFEGNRVGNPSPFHFIVGLRPLRVSSLFRELAHFSSQADLSSPISNSVKIFFMYSELSRLFIFSLVC